MTTSSNSSRAAVLTDWGVIEATGADAATFLHGQLTSDIEHLTDTDARLAGFCSAKGRLLASFIVWRPQPDLFLLACHRSVLERTVKRLSMFVLRAKCKLRDASADWVLRGMLDDPSATTLRAWQRDRESLSIRLPDAGSHTRLLTASPVEAQSLSLDEWNAVSLLAAIPTIEEAVIEQFVPQMINFELAGGVDFKKGCYPGQEIVARSQFRGTLKRRMGLFEVAGAQAKSGQEIFHADDPSQPSGIVVNATPIAAGSRLLAEVKLTVLESGGLRLGSIEGPLLVQRPLPYDIVDITD